LRKYSLMIIKAIRLYCLMQSGTFIAKRADIEKFMQSIALSSLSIQDLIIKLVKIHDSDIVKYLILHDACIYI